jgi:hypothetical protein
MMVKASTFLCGSTVRCSVSCECKGGIAIMRATEHPIKLIDSRIDPNTVAIIVLTVENFRVVVARSCL